MQQFGRAFFRGKPLTVDIMNCCNEIRTGVMTNGCTRHLYQFYKYVLLFNLFGCDRWFEALVGKENQPKLLCKVFVIIAITP